MSPSSSPSVARLLSTSPGKMPDTRTLAGGKPGGGMRKQYPHSQGTHSRLARFPWEGETGGGVWISTRRQTVDTEFLPICGRLLCRTALRKPKRQWWWWWWWWWFWGHAFPPGALTDCPNDITLFPFVSIFPTHPKVRFPAGRFNGHAVVVFVCTPFHHTPHPPHGLWLAVPECSYFGVLFLGDFALLCAWWTISLSSCRSYHKTADKFSVPWATIVTVRLKLEFASRLGGKEAAASVFVSGLLLFFLWQQAQEGKQSKANCRKYLTFFLTRRLCLSWRRWSGES